jgi:hypothetical protein
MKTTPPVAVSEPIQVSDRFRATVQDSILELERNAARDEQVLKTLISPDHQRRQKLLIQSQLDKAFRLREMLARLAVRKRPTR